MALCYDIEDEWHSISKDVVSCCVDRNGILLVLQGTTHFLHYYYSYQQLCFDRQQGNLPTIASKLIQGMFPTTQYIKNIRFQLGLSMGQQGGSNYKFIIESVDSIS